MDSSIGFPGRTRCLVLQGESANAGAGDISTLYEAQHELLVIPCLELAESCASNFWLVIWASVLTAILAHFSLRSW